MPRPKSPIQTDNSTATGVVNNTVVPLRSKMMDTHLWWLGCRASTHQFCYNWDAGSKNWANYHTEHHPPTYHEAHQSNHAGIWDWVGTRNIPPPQTIGSWVFPSWIFPFYFLPHFFTFPSSYFPTLDVGARVCRSSDFVPWVDLGTSVSQSTPNHQ